MKISKIASGNLALVGMPGAGKSSFGKKLATKTGKTFIDLDAFITEMSGRTIAEIFTTSGESVFRKLERDALGAVLKKTNIVLATGGGTPCFFDNMAQINQHAYSIWLNGSCLTLLQRVEKDLINRPLLHAAKTDEARIGILEKLLVERTPYYSLADNKVEIIGLKPEMVLDAYAAYCR